MWCLVSWYKEEKITVTEHKRLTDLIHDKFGKQYIPDLSTGSKFEARWTDGRTVYGEIKRASRKYSLISIV